MSFLFFFGSKLVKSFSTAQTAWDVPDVVISFITQVADRRENGLKGKNNRHTLDVTPRICIRPCCQARSLFQ
jgi:hypothetical protein